MITERNMVFANPQAYRVFPNIGNSMNTGITEQAVYQGYLQVTDSTGKTQSFTGTSTIDFTGFSGYVDIDQYSDVGSVKLGRWNIISNTPVEPVLPGQKTFAESTAADYVLYDKVNDEKICVEYGTDLSNYSSEQYTPIGVVVVPGTHDVYGDGSCGVMSLKNMCATDPDNGSSSNSTSGNNDVRLCWGSDGMVSNALSNSDGKSNSEILWGLATAQSDWKTSSTIINSSANHYFPATCCCWRYRTEGTQYGDWYLPALNELSYIMSSFDLINNAITRMKSFYNISVGVLLNTSNYYWSSSEYSNFHAKNLYTKDGSTRNDRKYSQNYVRAFSRVADDTQEQPIEEYEYVDLGLPSGLLWAKKNIGAETEEDGGLYFQRGDTQGYTAEQVGFEEGQKYFDWSDYKFSIDGSSRDFSKYNDSDSKTVLDPEDDAAHVNMGDNWRMPTLEECKELFINTDVYLVQTDDKEIHGTEVQNDENGYLINWDEEPTLSTLKGIKCYKKGDKQTYLFIPTSSSAYQGDVEGVGAAGVLWLASLRSLLIAWNSGFNDKIAGIGIGNRYLGSPVRGVKSNN